MQVGDTGLEPSQFPSRNTLVSNLAGSKSGNNEAMVATPTISTVPTDPKLAAIVAAWPTLPPAIRAGVMAMVKHASQNFGTTNT